MFLFCFFSNVFLAAFSSISSNPLVPQKIGFLILQGIWPGKSLAPFMYCTWNFYMDTAKNCWLFLEEFPFPHHHGVRYDSQPPSAVAALSLNHQFSPRIFGLHTVGNWLHVDDAKWFWWWRWKLLCPWKSNIDGENKPSPKKASHLPTNHFSGAM